MSKYLQRFSIDSFRGIKDLNITDTSDINILVGDNNTGKTSVLEALRMLRNPDNFYRVINISRLREPRNSFFYRVSIFETFTNLFNKNKKDMMLRIRGETRDTVLEIGITGNIENVMIDLEEVAKSDYKISQRLKRGEVIDSLETPMFIGTHNFVVNNNTATESINFSNYTDITGRIIGEPSIIDFTYVSPTDHTKGGIFSRIIKDDSFKNLVITVLQKFDNNINDLLLLKSEQFDSSVEYIKHSKLGNMPVSTYGDGIKKVILLADSIARAKNGILLIDEIETAIHVKAYPDIFNFVVKACVDFNVQLFATTHSIEALDSILKTQYNAKTEKYDKSKKDLIRVITLRREKKTGKTLTRVLAGEEVFNNRENFDFEVRI